MSDDSEDAWLELKKNHLPKQYEVDKRVKNIVYNLSPIQQKFCQRYVSSTMDEGTIAKSLGVSKRKLTMWLKDQYVQAYIQVLKEELHSNRNLEKMQAQNMLLREAMFEELMTRFDKPDWEQFQEDFGDLDIAEDLAKDYARRHAHFAAFKDLVKSFEVMQKSTEAERDLETSDQFVETVRIMHHKKRKKEKALMEQAQEQGIDLKTIFDINAYEYDHSGKAVIKDSGSGVEVLVGDDDTEGEHEIIEESVTIEQFSVFKKGEPEDEQE